MAAARRASSRVRSAGRPARPSVAHWNVSRYEQSYGHEGRLPRTSNGLVTVPRPPLTASREPLVAPVAGYHFGWYDENGAEPAARAHEALLAVAALVTRRDH
jgi:hypothetical protein